MKTQQQPSRRKPPQCPATAKRGARRKIFTQPVDPERVRTETAKNLDIHRTTLFRKIKALALNVTRK